MRIIFICCLLFSFYVLGQSSVSCVFGYTPVTESVPVLPDPYIEFNSFEGSYTTDSLYNTGHGLHICVDKNDQLSGSYDEVGILQGFVIITLGDDDEEGSITATGDFFEAGTGACIQGTFEIELTSWGFTGSFFCGGNAYDSFTFQEVRTNSFRPSDEQCAMLDRITPLAIEGSWETEEGYPFDGCLTDEFGAGSYLRKNESASFGDPLINGFVDGTQFLFGKVVSGTWYEEDSAGPILLFVRNTGILQAYRWTGLLGDRGRTVIDRTQSRQEEKHSIYTWEKYFGETPSSECFRFEIVMTFLLDNLPQDDDDAYYFINSDYFDIAIEPEYYIQTQTQTQSSSGSMINISFFSIIISFFITLII